MNQLIEDRHAELVRALIKTPDVLLSEVTAFKMSLIHSALGIAGEVGEIQVAIDNLNQGGEDSDLENLVEEAGDLYFYCRDLRHTMGLHPFVRKRPSDVTMGLSYYMGEVVDVVKKVCIYNQSFTVDKITRVQDNLDLFETLLQMELEHHHGAQDARTFALEHNLAKLNKRYEGMKYSDKAAEVRADKTD